MPLLKRDRAKKRPGRHGVVEDLERFARRVLVVPLAAPVFLLVGLGMGDVASRAMALPEYEPVRVTERTPRIQLEYLSRFMSELRDNGQRTSDFVALYNDHVAPVEKVLLGRGISEETARTVAWPLVEHSYRNGLDPTTVLAVLWIESRGKPDATSPVGARGLMQVMPMHAGRWVGCGRDLYDIESNLCYGTSILAWYLRRFPGDERRALLGYNGCVRGTNTPDCFRYPDKVWQIKRQIEGEMRPTLRVGAGASP